MHCNPRMSRVRGIRVASPNRRLRDQRSGFSVIVFLISSLTAWVQLPDITAPRGESNISGATVQTMFPHSLDGRYWISGQINLIFQANAPFHADYSGAHSFRPNYDSAFSHVETLYTGFQIIPSAELLFDVEQAGGIGLSDTFGIAGVPNLDAVRDATLGAAPYISRIMLCDHQFPLSPSMNSKPVMGGNMVRTFSW